MKNLLIALSIIPLLSCGIKKELEQANQTNRVLKEKVKVLEAKNSVKENELNDCNKTNSRLYRDYKELAEKLNSAQNRNTSTTEPEVPAEIFSIVEVMPEFPGGQAKMLSYISNKVRYPEIAKENNIQGKVYIQFVVNKDGSLSDAKVVRGIGGGCDEEALRAVNSMPNWTPGKQRGKPVRTRFILPVRFHLR
ncbi:energy transducer TonB [Flavobacteriales bacterium]|nr:energy transducer TonB [Flavobacteriales bacterium]